MVQGVSGIYSITDLKGRQYIGSSTCCKKRCSQHFAALKKGCHQNPKLQASFSKYGQDAFTFSLLEECEKVQLLIREQYYFDNLNPHYNINKVADKPPSWKSKKHSEATIQRFKSTRKGVKLSEQCLIKLRERRQTLESKAQMKVNASKRIVTDAYREKARAFSTGRKASDETKAKMSKAKTGREVSSETRSKISAIHIGKTLSVETKRRLSASHTGKVLSAEHRAKVLAALESRTDFNHSEETKEKLRLVCIKNSLARIGKKDSEETKRKRVETRLRTLAAKKEKEAADVAGS